MHTAFYQFICSNLSTQVHFLYQFSLQFFLDIYHSLMVDPQLEGIKEPAARLAIITQNLYSTCYERVTRGVLHQVC